MHSADDENTQGNRGQLSFGCAAATRDMQMAIAMPIIRVHIPALVRSSRRKLPTHQLLATEPATGFESLLHFECSEDIAQAGCRKRGAAFAAVAFLWCRTLIAYPEQARWPWAWY